LTLVDSKGTALTNDWESLPLPHYLVIRLEHVELFKSMAVRIP
jgi:hypothetical protein